MAKQPAARIAIGTKHAAFRLPGVPGLFGSRFAQKYHPECLCETRGSQSSDEGQASDDSEQCHRASTPNRGSAFERSDVDEKLADKPIKRRQARDGHCPY